MEKPIAHRVALRMKPATKQQLYVNQSAHKKEVRFCDKDGVARKLFVDQVYDIHSTTLHIFNDLLGKAHWEQMGETLFILLGGKASGKTYTLINASSDRKNQGSIEEERGLLFHLMDKIKRQGAARGQQIRCNYRFLEIEANEARNLGFELAQTEGLLQMGQENYDQQQIQEFSLSPDGSQDLAVILGKISRMRNPKGHFTVQVTIHPQSFRSTEKYVISFAELNASILQEGESGKQILEVISRILQNLTRIRMMMEEKQAAYFEDNPLTRILKSNFLSLRKWLVLGTLDEENMSSAIVCMNWLETLGEVRSDKALVDAQWRQVQRQEGLLKKLVEKHKKVMGILSKCIDLEPTQIDRRSLIYLECMPSQDKRGDKLKISNAKKAQNQEQIELLLRDISTVEQQIETIRDGHKKKVDELQQKREKAEQKRAKIWKEYALLKNPCYRAEGGTNPNSSSLFYKPLAIVKPEKQNNQTDSPPISCLSRAHLQSHNIVTRRQLDQTRNATALQLKRSNIKIQNGNENIEKTADLAHRSEIIKQIQIKRQINNLSALIVNQESWIEKTHSESSHLLSNNVINRIKCSKNGINLNLSLIKQCLLQDFQNEFAYTDYLRQEQTFQRFQRQFRQKQLAAQTVTTIKDI